jgi:hypothetical protein
MASQTLREAIKFSIVPETPEHIARHIWFPGADFTMAANPAMERVLKGAGLKPVEYFSIAKSLKNERGRVQIASEKAGAIALSEATGEQPILVFQKSKWSYEPSNYFAVPSEYERFPIDRLDFYQNMLKRVVSEAAFDHVRGATEVVDLSIPVTNN